ncbi:TonB-dependent receptor [Maribellus maritimus]|uniref:TonB-dependent receptor n=1 Tax=Maribellus maritimus TaxID=2870838 RepID=UPI001EEC6350|nr:TonB-dependent receptor [Maribellus maritimus]MCG6190329.1 TonB-dependent receptor [Maribellus maritimus]
MKKKRFFRAGAWPGIKKLLVIMKLTTFLLFFSAMAMATGSYSQDIRFDLSVRDASIVQVLEEIEKQTEFGFLFKTNQLNLDERYTLDLKRTKIETVMSKLLNGELYSYQIMDRIIVISKQSTEVSTDGEQLSERVTGKVTDNNGQPLPGVTVLVKGTTNGTVTDADGQYILSNVPEDATLQFSFVGMLKQEVLVGNQTIIDVAMTEDAIGLDEVMVVGYGTQKKADLTGAVSAVQGEELAKKIDVTNTATALQGLSPGLTIQNFAGEPGDEDVRVRIRGNGTLNNSDPLVLVDGVERSLATVEPSDIESLTLLKDAASAAIYGSRAANGVILITTKRGALEGTTVNYSYNVGFQNTLGYPEAADKISWLNLENEAQVNAGSDPIHTQEHIDNVAAGSDPLHYPFTVYEDYLFHTNAPQQRHNISLTSGGENGRIFASINYLDQDGAIHRFNNKRLSARINSDLYITDKLTANFNMNYMNRKATGPGFTAQRLVQAMLHMNRTIVGKYPDGTWDLISGQWNAIAMMENGERVSDRDEVVSQVGLEYKILPSLTFKGDITLKSYGQDESTFMNSLQGMRNYFTGELVTVGGWFAVNNLTERQENTKEWSQRAYLNFNQTFDKHSVEATAGYEGISNKYKWLQGYRQDFYNNDLRDLSSGASAAQTATGGREEWGLQSFFGRVNYAFDSKYLLQANIRYDGSSRFADGKRWGLFPSFSAGWRISQEGFLLDNRIISNLRLRASWGQLGNQDIGLYRYLNTYNLEESYAFNDGVVSGAAVTTAGNPEITWETTTMTNVGFDLGLFDNSMEIIAEYYWNLTEDILLSLPIAPTTGVGAPTQNAASVSNNGYEISVKYYSPRRNDGGFQYSVGLNFADVKNKIEDLKGTGPYFPDKFTVWQEGYSMTSLRGLKSPGLYLSEADFEKYPAKLVPQVTMGDIIYEDLNGDGVISQAMNPDGDQYIMGDEDPHYEFGISAEASYKSFDFSVFFQGVLQKYHTLDGALMEGPNWGNFIPAIMAKETWHPTRNPNGTWPLVTYGNSWNLVEADFWLQDAKYIRLKNIQLGYTIRPSKYISNVRVYLSGENLLTLTPTELFDPETPRGRSQFFPHTKVVSAGVNITF